MCNNRSSLPDSSAASTSADTTPGRGQAKKANPARYWIDKLNIDEVLKGKKMRRDTYQGPSLNAVSLLIEQCTSFLAKSHCNRGEQQQMDRQV